MFSRPPAILIAFVLLMGAGTRPAHAQSNTDREIKTLEARVKMYSDDYKAYDALGAAYIQKARETADAS